jgi:hypothetical protein
VEREHFFNTDLPELYHTDAQSLIIGGDFNCVLHPSDTTGQVNTSRALQETDGLHLVDAWVQNAQQPDITHYTPQGATRIDRIYMTQDLLVHKTGTEILPAANTDHEMMVLRLRMPLAETKRRRRRWMTDPPTIERSPNTRTHSGGLAEVAEESQILL